MTITARRRLRLPAWRTLCRAITLYAAAAIASLLYIGGASRAGDVTTLILFAGIVAPSGFATLVLLLLTAEERR